MRPRPEGVPARQDYGTTLSREQALAWDGPWGPTGAGSLTRWMDVPWQTDEASCNLDLVYTPSLYLSSPSFWGARVPNQVLPIEAYNIATTPDLAPLQVRRHFRNRRFWLRDLQGTVYAAFDPVTSQGLFNALSAGFFAGNAVADASSGDVAAPKVYDTLLLRTVDRTYATTHLQYAALPFDTPFWRHHARAGMEKKETAPIPA